MVKYREDISLMFVSKKTTRYAAIPITLGLAVAPIVASDATADTAKVSETNGRFTTDYKLDKLNWRGHDWAVRSTNDVMTWGGPQAAHPRDGERKWFNGAHINKKDKLIVENKGINGGVELILTESTGYGTYEFNYSADFDKMDPNNVLGIFTYDSAEAVINKTPGMEKHTNAGGKTEIDFIEISRWGQDNREHTYGGVTTYPDDSKNEDDRVSLKRFDIPKGFQTINTKAIWQENYLRVVTSLEDGTVLSDVTQTKRVPKDNGKQQLRINLWTTGQNKGSYKNAKGDKVIFSDFNFTPLGNKDNSSTDEKKDKSAAKENAKAIREQMVQMQDQLNDLQHQLYELEQML